VATAAADMVWGYMAEPSQQITIHNLPWSTANEDLVELFETPSNVEPAEIFFDNKVTRSPALYSLRWLPKPSAYGLPSANS